MKLDMCIFKEVISGVSEISSKQKWVKEEAGHGEMRVGSFIRCHLEEKIFFLDEIVELINKPRQELDTLSDKDSWSYLWRCQFSMGLSHFYMC